ncbi:MAG: hypothetical protein NVSMB2_28150 [Chloroflexota bacterium]
MALRDAINGRLTDTKTLADVRDRRFGLGIQPGDFPLLLIGQLASAAAVGGTA